MASTSAAGRSGVPGSGAEVQRESPPAKGWRGSFNEIGPYRMTILLPRRNARGHGGTGTTGRYGSECLIVRINHHGFSSHRSSGWPNGYRTTSRVVVMG